MYMLIVTFPLQISTDLLPPSLLTKLKKRIKSAYQPNNNTQHIA